MNKRKIGAIQETIAAEYLKNAGYRIIAQNFTCRGGEIDIIAQDHAYLVFVEVKYRTDIEYGEPTDAIDERKRHHLLHAAKYYLYKHGIGEDTPCRFDCIAISGKQIKHYTNYFEEV